MGLNLNLNINGAKRGLATPPIPTAFTSVFTVDTITGNLAWTDNSGGLATYEVYSNTNGAGDVLLATTVAGATSYGDTTCKQNASVVYKIRAKKGIVYSEYATATALVTPLCWKTDQTTRTNVVINTLNIEAGKTVNVDWGDGSNADYTGSNSNITKTYSASATNIFNIKLSGDVNSITSLIHQLQSLSYGVISNWILPSSITQLRIFSTSLSGDISSWMLPSKLDRLYIYSTLVSGDISNWIIPASITYFYCYLTQLSGACPQVESGSKILYYENRQSNFTDSNITRFNKGMVEFIIRTQNVIFPTENINKLLKAAADWFQNNAPTGNCTYRLDGANMGIPTDGASNVDLVRLAGYYTTAGFTATIVVRTS